MLVYRLDDGRPGRGSRLVQVLRMQLEGRGATTSGSGRPCQAEAWERVRTERQVGMVARKPYMRRLKDGGPC